jgi:hypothetical protein
MTLDQLEKLICIDLNAAEISPNTNEKAALFREASKAAYELDAFPFFSALESGWRSIEEGCKFHEEDRHRTSFESPLDSFSYNVDLGFYPPPEILLCLQRCFQIYFDSGGNKSLDEIFFGAPHQKMSSHSYSEEYKSRYSAFKFFFTSCDSFLDIDLKGKSLVERAEVYLNSNLSKEKNVDPETFLRSYRRWLQE